MPDCTPALRSGAMRIDSAGLPFIGGALALALIAGAAVAWRAGAAVRRPRPRSSLFFFRDPERASPRRSDDVVLSPADGRVLVAGRGDAGRGARRARGSRSASSCRRWTCTSTACRSSGRSRASAITPGKFLPAYHHDAATANERSEIWIDHERPDGRRAADRRHPRAARRLPRRTPATDVQRGRSLRHHEIRLAHGRVPAARRDDARRRSATWSAAAKPSSRCYTDRRCRC